MGIIVTARYEGKIDDRRERRIHAAFERCGVRMGVFKVDETADGELRKADGADGEMTFGFSDVEWTLNEDETDHELEIFVGDGVERANRLAAELRACGMIVVMRTEPEV